MKKMWFCYERTARGWHPVVYHDHKPATEKLSQDDSARRSPLYEVPEDCTAEGEPMFGLLQARFPAPKDVVA